MDLFEFHPKQINSKYFYNNTIFKITIWIRKYKNKHFSKKFTFLWMLPISVITIFSITALVVVIENRILRFLTMIHFCLVPFLLKLILEECSVINDTSQNSSLCSKDIISSLFLLCFLSLRYYHISKSSNLLFITLEISK